MAEKIKEVEVVEQTGEQQPADEQKQPVTQLVISMFDDGAININVPEGFQELQSIDIEMITRNVSEQLRDQRIAQKAMDLFKSKL